MEDQSIKAIERAQLRKEIYLLEKNLCIFDEIEQLKQSTFFLDKEKANQQQTMMFKQIERERKEAQRDEKLAKRKTFMVSQKTRHMKKMSMKQILAEQTKRMYDKKMEESIHRRKLRHTIMPNSVDLAQL